MMEILHTMELLEVRGSVTDVVCVNPVTRVLVGMYQTQQDQRLVYQELQLPIVNMQLQQVLLRIIAMVANPITQLQVLRLHVHLIQQLQIVDY